MLASHSTVFKAFLEENFATNEIHLDIPLAAFKILLEFMYKGNLCLSKYSKETVAVLLNLSHFLEYSELAEQITNYLCVVVDDLCVVKVLKIAKLLQIQQLEELCWNTIETSWFSCFNLPLNFLVELVFHRKRRIAEVKIFRIVVNLTRIEGYCTQQEKDALFSGIQWEKINESELGHGLERTYFENEGFLVKALERINLQPAPKLDQDVRRKVQITLLKGSKDIFSLENKFGVFNSIDREIIVDLGEIYTFNFIEFQLNMKSGYLIEILKDQQNWMNIVDYSKTLCCGYQRVFFFETNARFIKIIAGQSSDGLGLNSFDVAFVKNLPQLLDGITVPYFPRKFFFAYEEFNQIYTFEQQIQWNQFEDKGLQTPYYSQSIENGSIFVVFNQPYVLKNCRFNLWSFDGRQYSYKVETSLDFVNFDVISDKSDEKIGGWEVLRFSPRPVICFRITGVAATIGNEIRLTYFEAPFQY